MNDKINYDKEMQNIIGELSFKPKLLLHACCAPCATVCIERLKPFFDIVAYFYNPNIDGDEEYSLRAAELVRLCEFFDVKCVCDDYSPEVFYEAVKGLENEKERGGRCTVCYGLRLSAAAARTKSDGYDYFATTLTLSPLKDAQRLNAAGEAAAAKYGVKYLPSDFKKRGGFLRSAELSDKLGLYRQNYCGCKFSKNAELTVK